MQCSQPVRPPRRRPRLPEGLPAPAAEKVTLNVWWFDDPINMAMIKAYSDAHPTVDVNATAIGDIVFGDQKYLTAVAGGTGPDAAVQNRHTFFQFAAKGLYQDVTPWMDKSGMKTEDFAPVQMAESTWDGKVYGLPMFTDVRYLFWNTDHFEEVGLDPTKPPTTLEELAAYTDKLNVKKGDKMERYGFVPYLWGNSWMWLYGFLNKAPAISEDKRTILADDPKWVETLAVDGGLLRQVRRRLRDDQRLQPIDYVHRPRRPIPCRQGLDVGHRRLGRRRAAAHPRHQVGCRAHACAQRWGEGHLVLRLLDRDGADAPSTRTKHGTSCSGPPPSRAGKPRRLPRWPTSRRSGSASRSRASPSTARSSPATCPPSRCWKTKYVSKLGDREQRAWTLGIDALENWTHGCGTEMGVAALEYWVEMDNAAALGAGAQDLARRGDGYLQGQGPGSDRPRLGGHRQQGIASAQALVQETGGAQ